MHSHATLTDRKPLFRRLGHPPIGTDLMKLFHGGKLSKGGRNVKSERKKATIQNSEGWMNVTLERDISIMPRQNFGGIIFGKIKFKQRVTPMTHY